jgi:Ala-tRNA(Pro) deacylase
LVPAAWGATALSAWGLVKASRLSYHDPTPKSSVRGRTSAPTVRINGRQVSHGAEANWRVLTTAYQQEELMAISGKLKAFLDSSKVKYAVAKHPVAYTAQEIAAAQHVPGRQLAKSVLVNTDRESVLAVLPAIHLIDLKKLKAILKARTLTIAKEADINQRFPDVEVGAMSPFGNLYEVPVIVDQELGQADEIVFNGGSHTETVKMRYRDFATLVKPRVGAFGQPIGPARRTRKASAARKKTARPTARRSKRARPKKPSRRR